MIHQYQVITRGEPTTVVVPAPSRHVTRIKKILKDHGFKEVGPEGGLGWILDMGEISISGRSLDVERVAVVICAFLNGNPSPHFLNGAVISERTKRGALP